MELRTRKHLCAQALYAAVKQCFAKKFTQAPCPEGKGKAPPGISLVDCLMSGIALFALKFPSLLQYDIRRRHPRLAKNLKALFGINITPCDTYMRQRLDGIDPRDIRKAFKAIFAFAQRGKALELYRYEPLDNKYLLSIDGTGHFSSGTIHCENCCVKVTRTGQEVYYHQMLGAVIVHPDQKQVIPLAPEPILKKHGSAKNDCERNAARRLLEDVRREHPHLDLIVVEDSLSSNGPHIQELKRHGMSYILGVKPGDHPFLFDWVKDADKHTVEEVDEQGKVRQYSFVNEVPLNDAHFGLKVNFLEYWETDAKGAKQHFTWITDIKLNKDNVAAIMKGGRARWHIENNTFNTLKNQGYNFEHNFGHGRQNLCTVFGLLMMLAFLIDQVQELTCKVFKKARQLTGSYSSLWENFRALFVYCDLESWDDLLGKLIEANTPVPNTS